MILGERIKRIRTFRRLTQRELGLKLGYEERNADVRVAQYESGYRVFNKDSIFFIISVPIPCPRYSLYREMAREGISSSICP